MCQTSLIVLIYTQLRKFTVSVLGWKEGHTVKYTPSPEGVPKGKARETPEGKVVYLNKYTKLSPNADSISF